MKARHPATEMYKSRSDKITFMDAIDRMAREKHGSSWMKPTAAGGPMRLPKTREEATQTQLYYAVDVLKNIHPSLDFMEVLDFDDSVPSYARKNYPDLDISDGLWKEVRDNTDGNYNDESGRHSMLDDVLDDFATKAYEGRIKCFAHEEHTRTEKSIEARFWEVNEIALRSRYWSSSIELPHNKETVRYLILVDKTSLPQLQPVITPDVSERRRIVCENLRKAKYFNPLVPPHQTIGELCKIIAGILECNENEARELVSKETNNCWSTKGVRSKIAKEKGNPIKMMHESD